VATENEMYELVGRALADAEFRKSLKEDPEATLQSTGYRLDPEQIASLKKADLSTVAESLDDRLSKTIVFPK